MTRLRVSLLLVACSLTTLDAFGRQIGGGGPEPELRQQFPGPLRSATFGKILPGEFTDDLDLDAVVMDGSEPVLLFAPEVFDTALRTGAFANDFDVLPRAEDNDLIAVVGLSGLTTYEREGTAWITTVLADTTTDWAAGRAVRAGLIDPDGIPDLAGISGGGQKLLFKRGKPDGTFGPTFSLPTFDTAYGLELVDGDGDGQEEFVVLSDFGLEVYETNGTYAGSYAAPFSPLIVAVLRDESDGPDRLAMVDTAPNGDQSLSIYDGTGVEGPYDLGQAGVVSAVAGSVNADVDSLPDLHLSVNTERNYWVLLNQGAGETFDVDSILKVPYGEPTRDPTINEAGLALGDFDRDGDLDVLAPAQGDLVGVIQVHGEVILERNTTSPHTDYLVELAGVEYHDPNEPGEPNPVPHFLRLFLYEPKTTFSAEQSLRITVWRTPDWGLGTETEPYYSADIELPETDPFSYDVDLPGGYSGNEDLDIFTYTIFQIEKDPVGGLLTRKGPVWVGLYAPEPNWATLEESASTTLAVTAIRIPDDSNPYGGTGTGPSAPSNDDGDQPNQRP